MATGPSMEAFETLNDRYANALVRIKELTGMLDRIRALSDESTEYDGRGRIYVYADELDDVLDAATAGLGGQP